MKQARVEKLTSLLFETSRLIREHLKPGKRADSSTWLHVGTLRYIAKNEHATMREIAQFLSVAPPSATSLMEGFIRSGMVSRVQDAWDHRIARLHITLKGKKFLEKSRKDMVARMRGILKKLDAKDIDDLIRIMEKLREAYKN